MFEVLCRLDYYDCQNQLPPISVALPGLKSANGIVTEFSCLCFKRSDQSVALPFLHLNFLYLFYLVIFQFVCFSLIVGVLK